MVILQSAVCRFNQALVTYSVLGSSAWGVPSVFTAVWVVLRLTLNNSRCWRSYEAMGGGHLADQRLPINACPLFVRIVRELFAKIKSQPRSSAAFPELQENVEVYFCAGSGVRDLLHHLLANVRDAAKDRLGATLDCIKLFYEHFFNSFQGFFVSLLLCFVNSEAQREQKRLLLQTRPGRWLKARGILKPPADAFGLELENRRNNRRARRGCGEWGEQLTLDALQQQQQLCDDIKEDKEIA
uniref:Uncharacterized protein n=1 Tax=Macrostomum lignano TaxID=282301 RepID=A0A1I8FA57_9PLAT